MTLSLQESFEQVTTDGDQAYSMELCHQRVKGRNHIVPMTLIDYNTSGSYVLCVKIKLVKFLFVIVNTIMVQNDSNGLGVYLLTSCWIVFFYDWKSSLHTQMNALCMQDGEDEF